MENQKKPRTFLWTVICVAVYFIVISLLSAVDGPDGTPWVDSSVLGEAIKTLGLFAAAFGPILLDLRKDTRTVKHEVKNDHTTNLRVESDQRYAATKRWMETISKDIGGIRGELRDDREATRKELSELRQGVSEHSQRIRYIERRQHR